MSRMNGQTKIIVATACCLALVDIAVRTLIPAPGAANCATCPAMTSGDGVITARAVRLVDNDGHVRGLWNTDENGEPALWMYDRNGATRIELDTTENTPSLSLHDTDGSRRVYFGMNRDGSGLYTMMEPDGHTDTFSLDGSDNHAQIEMNGDGVFTQTQKLDTGVSTLYSNPSMRGTIFAPGVRPANGHTVEDGEPIVPQTTR